MEIKVKLEESAFMPTKAHEEDAGWDLRAPFQFRLVKGDSITIDTGVHVDIPKGYVGMVKSRSGMMAKEHVRTDGTIDAGYTGTIRVMLWKHNGLQSNFFRGDKIAQLVLLPIPETEMVQVDELRDSDRGDNGLGSTGR